MEEREKLYLRKIGRIAHLHTWRTEYTKCSPVGVRNEPGSRNSTCCEQLHLEEEAPEILVFRVLLTNIRDSVCVVRNASTDLPRRYFRFKSAHVESSLGVPECMNEYTFFEGLG